MSSALLRRRPAAAAASHGGAALLLLLRRMGGGPRTFPGGLNKWQYKRVHEKLARDKERKLLNNEKQIYQSRLRSELRASAASAAPAATGAGDGDGGPMSSHDHIKALADRFMKDGAEDLWNADDGPVRSPVRTPKPNPNPPIDLRKLVAERRGYEGADADTVPGRLESGRLETAGEARKCSWRDWRNRSARSNDVRNLSRPSFDQWRGYSAAAGRGPTVQTRKWKRNSSSDEDEGGDSWSGASLRNDLLKKFERGGEVTKRDLRFASEEKGKEARFTVGVEEDVESGAEFERSGERRKEGRFPRFSVGGEEEVEDVESGAKFERSGERRKEGRFPRFPRFSVGEVEDVEEGRGERRKMMSSAALRNHDAKVKRRVPRAGEDAEDGVSERIQEIRKLVNKRPVFESGARQHDVEEESVLTQKRFSECGISPLTIKALASAGYLQMTVVQEAALPVCLEGKDALVKARTGTGKTAAFLVPAIEAVLKGTTSKNLRVPPISVLILCPTRELAVQIAAEANVMLKYHEGMGVQTLIGGTRFKVDQKRLDSDPCEIIVATPGRLLDHIENKSGFSARLMGLKLLILDEADHLLDLGFRKDIEKVVDCIPRQRQSLLFSATIPKEVRRISQLVLNKEHAFVDTVGLRGSETPVKILQSYLVAPHELHYHIVHHILKEHIMKEPDYKVMVFCTTAMLAAFMFVFLRDLKMNVREMHSRKPQLYRSRISDEFRESKRITLVTSDVSARGVNYPDVTLVIQVGIPPDREQYIHRVGRTGREGKGGKGILVLAPWEEYFMDDIGDLPVQRSDIPELDPDMKQKVEESIGKVDNSIKEAAYHAWLGYYNSISEIGRDKTTLVELANIFSHSIGLQRPPALFRKTAIKMGLKDIPGILIRK